MVMPLGFCGAAAGVMEPIAEGIAGEMKQSYETLGLALLHALIRGA